MKNSLIMIVDDDKNIRDTIEMILEYNEAQVLKASSGIEALKILKNLEKEEKFVDIALVDIKMPRMDGIELLEKIKEKYPDIEVIMISGHGDIPTAVNATKKGAYDFLEKPLDENRLVITIKNALKNRKLAKECRILRKMLFEERQLLGNSPEMQKIFNTIKRIAETDARVLITGENGTGKELVARAIHENSHRADKPFIGINCAAIPENLIESELFGYEKGAFTSAVQSKKGKFELANGGTIFLDEIGDMNLSAQAKVLRVLEENKIERIGGIKSIPIDVRVIAATNKDLIKECEKGKFREDLYYRLNVVPIRVPPLRERVSDIPLLVSHFLEYFSKKNSLPLKKITTQALKRLQAYHWPGNVRELKNLIERLVILCEKNTIDAEEIDNYLQPSHHKIEGLIDTCKTFEDFKRESEKIFLLKKLLKNNWNIKKTAEELKMQRSNLYKKIEKYGLSNNKKEFQEYSS